MFLILLAAMTAALHTQADVLELKNGKVMTGSYGGGTAGTIRFQTAEGLQVIETAQALALTFTGGGAPAAAPAAAIATPAGAPASVNVPAGMTLFVRMVAALLPRTPGASVSPPLWKPISWSTVSWWPRRAPRFTAGSPTLSRRGAMQNRASST